MPQPGKAFMLFVQDNIQRAGIYAGWELVCRLPITAAD